MSLKVYWKLLPCLEYGFWKASFNAKPVFEYSRLTLVRVTEIRAKQVPRGNFIARNQCEARRNAASSFIRCCVGMHNEKNTRNRDGRNVKKMR